MLMEFRKGKVTRYIYISSLLKTEAIERIKVRLENAGFEFVGFCKYKRVMYK